MLLVSSRTCVSLEEIITRPLDADEALRVISVTPVSIPICSSNDTLFIAIIADILPRFLAKSADETEKLFATSLTASIICSACPASILKAFI